MAYKWILNGCEMEYITKPKPIHYQSISIPRTIEKHDQEIYRESQSYGMKKSPKNKTQVAIKNAKSRCLISWS